MTTDWRALSLSKYDADPIDLERKRYSQVDPPSTLKPNGFWVSVDGEYDWKWWCEREEFRLDALRVKHRVSLRSDTRILMIASHADLLTFTRAYGVSVPPPFNYTRSQRSDIQWAEVAEQYDGIIIAPYQWEARLAPETFWYYPWDCASGCIFDTRFVETFEVVNEERQDAI